jgi:hypothetical protein
MSEPVAQPKRDYHVLLEHPRSLFEYHAGQRLNTIQYFFVAYAIFVAAYVSTLTANKQPVDPLVQLALSTLALIVSMAFFALDLRNQRLVHVDEFALKELEKKIRIQYELEKFEIAEGWEEPKCWPPHFSVILPFLYVVIVLFSALATAYNAYRAFDVRHP